MSVVTKYSCPTCGSLISNNTSAINTHNKTKKHLNGINNTQNRNTDEVRALKLQRMREYRAKAREKLGEDAYKNKMKMAKLHFILNHLTI